MLKNRHEMKLTKLIGKQSPQIHFINDRIIEAEVEKFNSINELTLESEIALLEKAITLLDLTSLSADDTNGVITQLCCKAVHPLARTSKETRGHPLLPKLTTASVCVYPNRITDAVKALKKLNSSLPIAAVAGGFPSGQFPLSTRAQEVKLCVANGAHEIDIVVDRNLILTHQWEKLHTEINELVKAGAPSHVKVILSTGECGSLENIFEASVIAMEAGAHFIKTSTGKETTNATLQVGIVMCRAIKLHYMNHGVKIGFKPAGGIRTYHDVLKWMLLIQKELGTPWMTPLFFRLGASSVLDSIVGRLKVLYNEREGNRIV